MAPMHDFTKCQIIHPDGFLMRDYGVLGNLVIEVTYLFCQKGGGVWRGGYFTNRKD